MNEQAIDVSNPAWTLPRQGKGSLRGVTIRPGFGVAIADLTYEEQVEAAHPGGDFLRVQYKVEGESAISGEDRDFATVQASRVAFVVQPTDSIKHQRIGAHTHSRSVTLSCSREFVSSLVPGERALPVPIDDFVRNRVSRFSYASIPLPPQMRLIAEDILRNPHTGSLGEVMLECKALELMCLTLHQVLAVPAAGGAVRGRDLSRVRDLCAHIEANPGCTLSIAELCRLTAWNETQMMECFKQVTGTTIFSYLRRVRMENARRQLALTDASITEIAFDAGYEHASNFATAFKRAYGVPPTSLRARAR